MLFLEEAQRDIPSAISRLKALAQARACNPLSLPMPSAGLLPQPFYVQWPAKRPTDSQPHPHRPMAAHPSAVPHQELPPRCHHSHRMQA